MQIREVKEINQSFKLIHLENHQSINLYGII